MTEQQEQRPASSSATGTGRAPPSQSSNTTGNNNGGGNGASKAEKKKAARDRKKARDKQKKNVSGNQPRNKFKGRITDAAHLMHGHVITPGGNMADQCRILKRQIKLHSSSKGYYKLSSSISTNTTLQQTDFLTAAPEPSLYSTMTTAPGGVITYTVTDPMLKEQLILIWGKNIASDITAWNKYEEFSKGLFETTMGQLDDKVLATCRQDTVRWLPIESGNDLIALLQLVEMICTHNKAGRKVYVPYENIGIIERCVSISQSAGTTTTEFAAQVNVMYTSVIQQCGRSAFGENFLIDILDRYSTNITAYNLLLVDNVDKIKYDAEARDLIVAMLILKGSNNTRARDCIKEQYLLGTRDDDVYPNTETKVITLLDSLNRSNNNSNNNNNNNNDNNETDAVVAAHGADYQYCTDDDDADDKSVLSSKSVDSADEADVLANIKEEDVTSSPPPPATDTEAKKASDDFQATILANAVAEYDNDLQDIEDGFINRIDNQQDVEDAFEQDEPNAIAAAHLVINDSPDDEEEVDDDISEQHVCLAHVAYLETDRNTVPGVEVPEFILGANKIADSLDLLIENIGTNGDLGYVMEGFGESEMYPCELAEEFEMMLYHTAHRVMHKKSSKVTVFRYDPESPDLTCHNYGPYIMGVPESILDYADALRYKFKMAGILDIPQLLDEYITMDNDINNMKQLKIRFNDCGFKGINTSTVTIIREEIMKSLAHKKFNGLRYRQMILEIGPDFRMTFWDDEDKFVKERNLDLIEPAGVRALHHVVYTVAVTQGRHKPNRWINKVVQKLINSNINSIYDIETCMDDHSLNNRIEQHGMPRLHDVTIYGITRALGDRRKEWRKAAHALRTVVPPDFRKGRR